MTPTDQERQEWIEEINILCSIAETHGVLATETRKLMDRLQAFLSRPHFTYRHIGKLKPLHYPLDDEADTPPLPEDKGRLSEHPCKKCGEKQVYVQEINDYPDYRITCHACKHSYCVDGPDS